MVFSVRRRRKANAYGKIDEGSIVINKIFVNNPRTSYVLNKEGEPVYKTENTIRTWVEYIENDLVKNEDEVEEYKKGDII